MASKINHKIEAGADFRLAMEIRDEAGALINLTGYEFRGQAREKHASPIAFSLVFALRDQTTSTGMVDIHITSQSTTDLKLVSEKEYLYDIEMVDAALEVRRMMEGTIKVIPEVTK